MSVCRVVSVGVRTCGNEDRTVKSGKSADLAMAWGREVAGGSRGVSVFDR